MSDAALELTNVTRQFKQAGRTIDVLNGIDFALAKGEMVALVGPSGSGKTTLLQIAGLLDSPTGGEIYVGGKAAHSLNDHARTSLRRSEIGFVYQFHHLLPEFSARENVAVPQMIAGKSKAEATRRAEELLDMLGLSDRLSHRPAALSGGEQQRVAIARALANHPAVILADEPTGNLDEQTAETVMAVFVKVAREEGVAALMATHNLELAARLERTLRVHGGRVEVAV